MPITLLDLILLAVMLVSALLAMVRGFMRTVLGIICCALAILAAAAVRPPISMASFADNLTGATAVTAAVFVVTIVLTVIVAARVATWMLRSEIGVFDRILGSVVGLLRGLMLVVVPLLAFLWLIPDRNHPSWIRDASSRPILQATGQWLMSLLLTDPETTVLKRLRPETGPVAKEPAGSESLQSYIGVRAFFLLLLASLPAILVDLVAIVARMAHPERYPSRQCR